MHSGAGLQSYFTEPEHSQDQSCRFLAEVLRAYVNYERKLEVLRVSLCSDRSFIPEKYFRCLRDYFKDQLSPISRMSDQKPGEKKARHLSPESKRRRLISFSCLFAILSEPALKIGLDDEQEIARALKRSSSRQGLSKRDFLRIVLPRTNFQLRHETISRKELEYNYNSDPINPMTIQTLKEILKTEIEMYQDLENLKKISLSRAGFRLDAFALFQHLDTNRMGFLDFHTLKNATGVLNDFLFSDFTMIADRVKLQENEMKSLSFHDFTNLLLPRRDERQESDSSFEDEKESSGQLPHFPSTENGVVEKTRFEPASLGWDKNRNNPPPGFRESFEYRKAGVFAENQDYALEASQRGAELGSLSFGPKMLIGSEKGLFSTSAPRMQNPLVPFYENSKSTSPGEEFLRHANAADFQRENKFDQRSQHQKHLNFTTLSANHSDISRSVSRSNSHLSRENGGQTRSTSPLTAKLRRIQLDENDSKKHISRAHRIKALSPGHHKEFYESTTTRTDGGPIVKPATNFDLFSHSGRNLLDSPSRLNHEDFQIKTLRDNYNPRGLPAGIPDPKRTSSYDQYQGRNEQLPKGFERSGRGTAADSYEQTSVYDEQLILNKNIEDIILSRPLKESSPIKATSPLSLDQNYNNTTFYRYQGPLLSQRENSPYWYNQIKSQDLASSARIFSGREPRHYDPYRNKAPEDLENLFTQLSNRSFSNNSRISGKSRSRSPNKRIFDKFIPASPERPGALASHRTASNEPSPFLHTRQNPPDELSRNRAILLQTQREKKASVNRFKEGRGDIFSDLNNYAFNPGRANEKLYREQSRAFAPKSLPL